MDGGVQRGTDIAKALAMGADSVGLGKPYLYGLAAGGTEGVIKALEILRVELDRAMGLLGTGTVDDLKKRGPGLVKRRGASARDCELIASEPLLYCCSHFISLTRRDRP